MTGSLNNSIFHATKWSAITELVARLVSPIVSIILAHILVPEAFGVVTTIIMVITFAEIFTDAGFQKYIIQHEFEDYNDINISTNVAFWSNFVLSILIWILIIFYCEPLACLVGNPGLGYVIAIACISIPLEAFSSIQMALYKRDFDFKTLFKCRLVGIFIPFFVTVPCALIFKNFWALIIGNIVRDVLNAILLTYYSKWKPFFYFSFEKLKKMISFSIWSMIEAVTIWLASYVDIFIVGTILSQHYLGLYKVSSAVVGQILGLVVATTTPILFSALSRLQNDEKEFNHLFFEFQKVVAVIVIPLGVGLLCYKNFITNYLLGSQWTEASFFLGWWGFTSAIMIVLAHYCSEVYRAKGKPKLSVLAQILHIIVLWPTVLIAARYGYDTLCLARALIRFQGILVNMIIMYYLIKISPLRMIINIVPSCIAASTIFILYYLMPQKDSIIINILFILFSILSYVLVLQLFKEEKLIVIKIKKYTISNIMKLNQR